jgi:hypothetical protein
MSTCSCSKFHLDYKYEVSFGKIRLDFEKRRETWMNIKNGNYENRNNQIQTSYKTYSIVIQ